MSFKYLALGDSYTIGESVPADERWPHILQGRLIGEGIQMNQPDIIATTGWTTDELLDGIKKDNPHNNYDLVSLLIGVNNQYRGYKLDIYIIEFRKLLALAIGFVGKKKRKVFVISIPDYGVTPFAKEKDSEKIARELDEYNEQAKVICKENGILFFDITTGSRNALNDPSLIAEDGLHPSGKMYKQWVDQIYADVKKMLL